MFNVSFFKSGKQKQISLIITAILNSHKHTQDKGRSRSVMIDASGGGCILANVCMKFHQP